MFLKDSPTLRKNPNTFQVGARDRDKLDVQGLLYTVEGDGVDGLHPTRTFFSINSHTGDLMLLRVSRLGDVGM